MKHMPASVKTSNTIGYLSFVEVPPHGIVGGYLLVDERARPMEFHCTAPVQRDRTQQILYGDTFRTALLCDQIGVALLKQTRTSPALIITDEPDAVSLRSLVDIPLALITDSDALDWSFEYAGCTVTTATNFECDRETVRNLILTTCPDRDLAEPIERIRAAVNEAQRAAA